MRIFLNLLWIILLMASKVAKWVSCACLLMLVVTSAGCAQDNSKKGNSGQKTDKSSQKAVSAKVIRIKRHTLVLDKRYSSLLNSPRSVTVVARVSGLLKKQFYDAGDFVEKGQELFTIDPAPYQAKVEAAKANLASARADRHKSTLKWQRISTLYKRHAVSEQDRDNARANLEMAKAAVGQASASLDQAQIRLGYTAVEAPVSGQVGLREVNLGNFVQPPKALTTITPLDPINARFAVPIRDAEAIRRQKSKEKDSVIKARLHAGGKVLTGELDFLGSQVNRQTGKVTARATFGNPQHIVMPGQYDQVFLLDLRLANLIAVPQVAVTEGQEGTRVYVLDDNNRVKPATIETGKRTSTHWVVVKNGLKPGAKVVVDHISKVEAGTRIKPEMISPNPNKTFSKNDGTASGGNEDQQKDGSTE